MSIIVSQSLASSHPLDHEPTKAVGITFPLTRGSTGYFSQSWTTAEAIRVDLINLLLTNKGERPMKPNFGSRLQSILFEQNTDDIEPLVESAVRDAISTYMPFVVVDRVESLKDIGDHDIYKLKVLITYHVPSIVGESDLGFLVAT